MLENYQPLTRLGFVLVIIGLVLIALPLFAKYIPSLQELERVPSILLYVYRRGDFLFITSPILLIVGIAVLIYILSRSSI